jgi:hypothetical protein
MVNLYLEIQLRVEKCSFDLGHLWKFMKLGDGFNIVVS